MFDAIAQEIGRGEIDKGLWAEAFAAADGTESVAKARYIQFRVRQLTRQAHRPLSTYDLGTALIWVFAVGFCGLAASTILADIGYSSKGLFNLVLIMACLGVFCAWCTRRLFQKAIARLAGQTPTRAYWVLEFVVVAALAFTLAAYMNSQAPDPLASSLAGAAMAFVPYGFMARARAKRLTQTTVAPEPTPA